jgi:hypothetical protein
VGVKEGDTVYLRPKTLTAPAVCWNTQTPVKVVSVEPPYVRICHEPTGAIHRIHQDNVTNRAPKPPKPLVTKQGAILPPGYEEVSLW